MKYGDDYDWKAERDAWLYDCDEETARQRWEEYKARRDRGVLLPTCKHCGHSVTLNDLPNNCPMCGAKVVKE